MIKREKRINLDSGLKVDTKTSGSLHTPTIPRIDSRYDFLESPTGVGSVRIRFTITDLGTANTSYFKLIGSTEDNNGYQYDGWHIIVNKAASNIIYFWAGTHKAGVDSRFLFKGFAFTPVLGITYDLVLVKNAAVTRLYVNGVKITDGTNTDVSYSGYTKSTNPIRIAGKETVENKVNSGIATVYQVTFFNTEIDRKAGAAFLGYIEGMEAVGNWVHPDLAAYVVDEYCCQEKYGNKLFDSVARHNWAKEEITNVNTGFDTDTTWAKTGTWVISGGVASAETVIGNSSGFHNILKAQTIVAGRTYRVRFKVLECSGGALGVYVILGNTITSTVYGVGAYDLILTALTGGFIGIQQVVNGTVGWKVVIDDLIFDAYSHAKLTPNHADLIGYTDTQLGVTDKTTQTARVGFYDKTLTNFWDGSGNELKSGLPELKNALFVDGTHTVSYPAGTVILGFPNYNVLAYHLKTGQTLTKRQELNLLNTNQFANPTPDILNKLDGLWQHNSVYDNAGTPSLKDWVGTNHLPLSSYTANQLNPAHANYAVKELRKLKIGDQVGFWKADEASGATLSDSSGYLNNATITGTASRVARGSGSAWSLNGSTNYATVANNEDLSITGAITLAAWIRPTTAATQPIIKKALNSATNGFELSLSSSGKAFFRINQTTSGDTYRLDSAASYPTDATTWMHIAAVYDGTSIKIYVNGIQDVTASPASPPTIASNTLALTLGANPDGSNKFGGLLDDLRIYNKALTASEIAAIAV